MAFQPRRLRQSGRVMVAPQRNREMVLQRPGSGCRRSRCTSRRVGVRAMSHVVDELETTVMDALPGDCAENGVYLDQLAHRLALVAADLRGHTSGSTGSYRYVAAFSPEAWISDEAVPVDPLGDTTWDCTNRVTANLDYFTRLQESGTNGDWDSDFHGLLDTDDVLANDPDSPEWVRQWVGPSTVRVHREHVSREQSAPDATVLVTVEDGQTWPDTTPGVRVEFLDWDDAADDADYIRDKLAMLETLTGIDPDTVTAYRQRLTNMLRDHGELCLHTNQRVDPDSCLFVCTDCGELLGR